MLRDYAAAQAHELWGLRRSDYAAASVISLGLAWVVLGFLDGRAGSIIGIFAVLLAVVTSALAVLPWPVEAEE